jgi:hypothetical protein
MTRPERIARWFSAVGAACLFAFGTMQAHADPGSLRARYTELRDEMRNNSYGRQLYIDSMENGNSLQGDVYAVLDHPFHDVKEALQDPNAWCDIMLLPFNTKACRAIGSGLSVRIGRKYDQPVDQAYRIDFGFRNLAANANYLQTRLNAGQGPFGTRDYRIDVEAVPLENGRTFMHMRYSYGFGGMARFAMQAYMATAGASKVGFTSGGVRGAVERNAMRYYLAIDSYLDTMDLPPQQRVERRINHWFSATERYPQQLHEMDRSTYVNMKRVEYDRQVTASGPQASAEQTAVTQ